MPVKKANQEERPPLERCVARPIVLGISSLFIFLTVLMVLAVYPAAKENGMGLWLVFGAVLVLAVCETVLIALLRYVSKKYLQPVTAAAAAVVSAVSGDMTQTQTTIPSATQEAAALLQAVEDLSERSTDCLLALERALNKMSAGDFTVRIDCGQAADCKGVCGALEATGQKLRGALGAVRTSIEQLTGPLDHLEHNIQALSQSAPQHQSQELLLCSLERLTLQQRQRADGAAAVSSAADTLRQKLLCFDQQQRELTQALDRISDYVLEAERIVKDMEAASFQSSVLARTAYVEAASAGVDGKGFAIVASELRVLASRTAQSTQEAAVFIDELRQTVREGAALASAAARDLQAVTAAGTEVCRKAAGAAQTAAQEKELQEAVRQATRLEALSEDVEHRAAGAVKTAQLLKQRFGRIRAALQIFRLHND